MLRSECTSECRPPVIWWFPSTTSCPSSRWAQIYPQGFPAGASKPTHWSGSCSTCPSARLRHSHFSKPAQNSSEALLAITAIRIPTLWWIPQHLHCRITLQALHGPANTHLYLFRKKIHWHSTILQTSSQATGMFCRSPGMQQDSTFPRVPTVLLWVMTQIKSCRHSLCRELHHLGACAENTRDTCLQACILTPAEEGRTKKAFYLEMSGQELKTATADSSVCRVGYPVKPCVLALPTLSV